MSLYVVDASVAVKWFVPENLTPEAVKFRNSGHVLHAPAFFDVEITNIVWKKLQRGEINRQDADDIVKQTCNASRGSAFGSTTACFRVRHGGHHKADGLRLLVSRAGSATRRCDDHCR